MAYLHYTCLGSWRTGSSGGRLGGGGGGAVHMVGAVNLARARSLFVVARVVSSLPPSRSQVSGNISSGSRTIASDILHLGPLTIPVNADHLDMKVSCECYENIKAIIQMSQP